MSARAAKPARERTAKAGVETKPSPAFRARRRSGCVVVMASRFLLRQADGDRFRLHLDGEALDLLAVAAVDLVEHLATQLHLDLLRSRRLDERRSLGMTGRRAGERPQPVGDAVGVHDPHLEASVVGTRVLEHLDAAEEPSDVPDEDATRVVRVPGDSVDLDLRLERLRT